MSTIRRLFSHGDKESRRRKACERLGTDAPACIFHDEFDPLCLQLHHVAGREFNAETIPLCHNHHARISDAQKDHPPKIDGCTSPLEELGHFVLGLSELLLPAAKQIEGAEIDALLMYICWKLRKIGFTLIDIARAAPDVNSEDAP